MVFTEQPKLLKRESLFSNSVVIVYINKYVLMHISLKLILTNVWNKI